MIKRLNNFFFGYEELSSHDLIWFYGFYGLFTMIFLIAVLPVWIRMLGGM